MKFLNLNLKQDFDIKWLLAHSANLESDFNGHNRILHAQLPRKKLVWIPFAKMAINFPSQHFQSMTETYPYNTRKAHCVCCVWCNLRLKIQ